MSKAPGAVHIEDLGVIWTQAQGPIYAPDRIFRLTKPHIHPSAIEPCPSQVRIKSQSPTDAIDAMIESAYNKDLSNTGGGQGDRVISA